MPDSELEQVLLAQTCYRVLQETGQNHSLSRFNKRLEEHP